MQTALKLIATVSPAGKLEISTPELSPGKTVEVIILLPAADLPANETPQPVSALDILRQSPGRRQFKTAEAVADHLRQEREL
jgi:hypothetical protein